MTSIDLVEFDAIGARKEITGSILQMIDDDKVGAFDLADLVSRDPILAAKVMKMANSVYYGLSGRVGDLKFAISVIGFITLRSIVVSSIINKVTPISKEAWRRYLVTAGLAAELAPSLDVDLGEAICGGMMLDIGELVLAHHDLSGYSRIIRDLAALPLFLRDSLTEQRERDVYSVSHSELSESLLRRWKFPEDICKAVGRHHSFSDTSTPLDKCLYSAAALVPYFHRNVEGLEESLILPEELMHANYAKMFEKVRSFVESTLVI